MNRSPATKVSAWRRKFPGALPAVRTGVEGSNDGQAVMVEMLIDGIWVDLAALGLVLGADQVQISQRGRPGESSVSGPATCDFTAKNLDFAFSLANPESPYWGKVGLGTRIRISVPRGNGVSIRFQGELSSVPQLSDITGGYSVVGFEASGILRRITQGAKSLDSALLRFIKGHDALECWPLTDGATSTTGGALFNSASKAMKVILDSGTTQPVWAGGSLASWIEPVVQISPSTDGIMPGYTPSRTEAASGWSVDMCFSGATLGDLDWLTADRGAATDADPRHNFYLAISQATDNITLTISTIGETSTSSSLVSTMSSTGVFDGDSHHLRLTIGIGATTSWEVFLDGASLDSGTFAIVTKTVRYTQPGWFMNAVTSNTPSLGYVTYWGGNPPSAADAYSALLGFQGEEAATRVSRLCAEAGITYEQIGSGSTTTMGHQTMDTFLTLLRQCESTDDGILYEMTSDFGLGYRTRESLLNQDAVLTLTHSSHELSAPLMPLTDDSFIANDVTATRTGGTSFNDVQLTGPRSVQPPPSGVGRYDVSLEFSLEDDSQVGSAASWARHKGTVNEARYKAVQVQLASSELTGTTKRNTILDLVCGDRIVITGLPDRYGPDDISQLAVGFTETIDKFTHTISMNAVPETPYRTGELDSTSSVMGGVKPRAGTTDSRLVGAVDTVATSITVASSSGAAWTTTHSDTPLNLRINGEVMTVVAVGTALGTNPLLTTDTTGWTGNNASIARTTAVTYSTEATASLQITPDGSSSAGGVNGARTAAGTVTVGATYTAVCRVYSPLGWSDLRAVIDWYDSGGVFLSSSLGSATVVAAGTWTFLTQSFVAPASADSLVPRARHGGTPAVTDIWYTWAIRVIPDASVLSTSPQNFTMARSINGVVKNHNDNSSVTLAAPTIVGM